MKPRPRLQLLPLVLLASLASPSGARGAAEDQGGPGGAAAGGAAAGVGAGAPALEGEPPPSVVGINLEDPHGDDHGPGSYRYPIDSRMLPGSFDLTSLTLEEEGERLLRAEICFRARPRPVPGVRISQYEAVELLPQAVDIYLDTDGVPGSGLTRALPGRRVRIDQAFAWEKVLVVQPRERLFRMWLDQVDREAGQRTVSSARVSLRGRCLLARFPREGLPRPRAGWGVLVLVSGARFYPTFQLGERLRGETRGEEFTRDVQTVPGSCVADDSSTFDCAFGGCRPCGNHPLVIDALLCGGQKAALSSYDPQSGRLAELGGLRIGPDGRGACPAEAAAALEGAPAPARAPAAEGAAPAPAPTATTEATYRIAGQLDRLVSIVGGEPRAAGELGTVHDAAGSAVGRLVVTGRAGPVTLAEPVPGGATALQPGMTVRFVAQPPDGSRAGDGESGAPPAEVGER